MSDQAPIQLRWFADDCEERVRVYRDAARRARDAIINPHLSSVDRRAILDELRHFVGQMFTDQQPCSNQSNKIRGLHLLPADKRSELPPNTLGTAQLAELFGMDRRNVQRAFERAMRDNLPGFYWTGSQWRADPEAFAREVSELCPRARRKLQYAHDKADHSPRANETGPQADCAPCRRG